MPKSGNCRSFAGQTTECMLFFLPLSPAMTFAHKTIQAENLNKVYLHHCVFYNPRRALGLLLRRECEKVNEPFFTHKAACIAVKDSP